MLAGFLGAYLQRLLPDADPVGPAKESLKHMMEHASGHLVATGALAMIGQLLPHAAH